MSKVQKVTVESLKNQMISYENKIEKLKEKIKTVELEEKLSNYKELKRVL